MAEAVTSSILDIDTSIQKKFEEEKKEIPNLKERLEDLKKTLNSPSISERIYRKVEKAITETQNRICKIEEGIEYTYYIYETSSLIEEYRKLLHVPIQLSFTGRLEDSDNGKTVISEKFLEISKKYAYVENKKVKKNIIVRRDKFSCDNCQNKISFTFEENACICDLCGAQKDLIRYTSSYKDVGRVNMSAKYTYDRKVHFRDCMNQYQGKQNCSIEQKVYDELEIAFEMHNLLLGDKNVPKEERFSKISRDHVLFFLKELEYSKHYENVIYIHYVMTGKKPDDISYLEDALMGDFDILIETYDKNFKNKVNRTNFISTHVVLYQLLCRRKHKCRKEDFFILKSIERKDFHHDICKELFEFLGWGYTPMY